MQRRRSSSGPSVTHLSSFGTKLDLEVGSEVQESRPNDETGQRAWIGLGEKHMAGACNLAWNGLKDSKTCN
jgi:hypothetical protein